jgi:hypothetical protein
MAASFGAMGLGEESALESSTLLALAEIDL